MYYTKKQVEGSVKAANYAYVENLRQENQPVNGTKTSMLHVFETEMELSASYYDENGIKRTKKDEKGNVIMFKPDYVDISEYGLLAIGNEIGYEVTHGYEAIPVYEYEDGKVHIAPGFKYEREVREIFAKAKAAC